MLDFSFDAGSAVRIVCGLFFLPHTVAKLSHIDRAAKLFHSVGFRPARPFVVLTAVLELFTATTFVSGRYVEAGAVVGATVLLGAAYAIGRTHGLKWRWQHPGIEYMLFWAITCLLVGFLR